VIGARVDVDADRVGSRGGGEIDADQRAPAARVDGEWRDGAIEGADVNRGIGRRDDGEDDELAGPDRARLRRYRQSRREKKVSQQVQSRVATYPLRARTR
jgi:hypothetical protein